MTLIVEDGSIVEDADSYVEIAYVDTYLYNRGVSTWVNLSTLQKEAAIRRAMVFIEGFDYLGTRYSDYQYLEFPREGIYYDSGNEIGPIIPTEIKNALCEAAYAESVEAGSLFPLKADRNLKRRKVGSIEREYFKSSSGINSNQPIILNLLKRFIYSGYRVARC